MRTLIGIDDTDILGGRGTGQMSRRLAQTLLEDGLAAVQGITRHQLLVDPRIPYTSHNSSACLVAEVAPDAVERVYRVCREFLLRECPDGSDAGLCLVAWDQVDGAIQAFGVSAKYEVLEMEAAVALGQQAGLRLEGLTGTGGGVIGALAAVGLRVGGNDGRVLWLPGLRELEGVYTASDLRRITGLDTIQTLTGAEVAPTARIDVGDWPRPILRDGRITLLVEEAVQHEYSDWQMAQRDYIKSITD